MPRKGTIKPRKVGPDPVYGHFLVTKLINRSMKDGKKSVAQKEVYRAFKIIQEKTKEDPIKTFELALTKIRPEMEVRPRRIGGAAYQVPMSVRGTRKDSLAIRWLIQAARKRSNSEYHTYGDKLAAEILDAAKDEGGAVQKKKESERMALANQAFAHFKW